MRQALQVMMVIALCCGACVSGGQANTTNAARWKPTERLAEAQAEFDEAENLEKAGK